jgi:hypothetical protein
MLATYLQFSTLWDRPAPTSDQLQRCLHGEIFSTLSRIPSAYTQISSLGKKILYIPEPEVAYPRGPPMFLDPEEINHHSWPAP